MNAAHSMRFTGPVMNNSYIYMLSTDVCWWILFCAQRDISGTKCDFSVQVQLRFCLSETSCPQEDHFPPNLCVKVNGKPCNLPVRSSAFKGFFFPAAHSWRVTGFSFDEYLNFKTSLCSNFLFFPLISLSVIQGYLPPTKNGVEPKRPSRPINITSLVRLSTTVPNTIVVSWTAEIGRVRAKVS